MMGWARIVHGGVAVQTHAEVRMRSAQSRAPKCLIASGAIPFSTRMCANTLVNVARYYAHRLRLVALTETAVALPQMVRSLM